MLMAGRDKGLLHFGQPNLHGQHVGLHRGVGSLAGTDDLQMLLDLPHGLLANCGQFAGLKDPVIRLRNAKDEFVLNSRQGETGGLAVGRRRLGFGHAASAGIDPLLDEQLGMKIIDDPWVVEIDRRVEPALLQQVHEGLGRVVGHGIVFGNAEAGIKLRAGAGQDGVGNLSALSAARRSGLQ